MGLLYILKDVRYWIASALVLGIIVGNIGDFSSTVIMVTLVIMMTVSLQGLEFSKSDFVTRKKDIVIAMLMCYGVSALTTLAIGAFYMPFSHDMWLGWVMIAAVPSAIATVSATLMLKGDIKLAMICTTVLYIAALGITPIITRLFMGAAISPFEILKYVAIFIVIPFLFSIPLKKVKMSPDIKAIIINICFFMLVFMSFGANRNILFGDPVASLILLGVSIIRLALPFFIMEWLLKKMSFHRDERIPLVLFSLWKNTALALSITMVILPPIAALPGAVTVPLELIWFTFMTWYYTTKQPPEPLAVRMGLIDTEGRN